jgi:Myb/SANT-like DNA-binding domain
MSPKKGKAKWDDNRDWTLIKNLLHYKRKGEKSDSGFKAQIWKEITDNFNQKWTPKYNRQQLQSRAQNVFSYFSLK